MLSLLVVGACGGNHRSSPATTPADGSLIISDRLSNQKVNAFAEDTDGHIWIATFRGLNKYDVYEYHQYFCADDTLGLPDNQVNHVFCDHDGKLWAATVNGVAYRTQEGRFHRVIVQDGNKNISQVLETRSGKVLFSNGNILFQFDEEKDVLRPVIRDLASFGFPSMVIDSDDRLWVNTGAALNCYETAGMTLETSVPLPHPVYHICDAGGGELWMSGMGSLSILDVQTLQWKPLPDAIRNTSGLMGGDIDIIFSVDNRTLLLNVIGKGMYCYHRYRETLVHQNDADFPFTLPDAEIRSIFRDSRQNLWFGTTDQGYSVSYQYKDQFNSNKYLTEAFSHKSVTALSLDHAGNLWICTLRDGLFVYNLGSKSLKRIDVNPLIPDNNVGFIRCTGVFCDNDGDLWLLFSEKYRVIRCRYDGRNLKMLDQLGMVNPLAIAQDDQGRFWIGGFSNQVVKYDKQTKERKDISVQCGDDWTFVLDLVLEEAGSLLVASFNQPVLRINTYTDEVEQIQLSEREKEAFVRRSVLIPNKLFKDSSGELWIGTVANGLLHSNDKNGIREVVSDAPCLDICSIQEDRQGNIWVSTMNGLGKYDRTVGRFVNYFEADGIGGNQFSDRASCILEDGTLVFGGTHGLTWFNPQDVPRKRTVPLVFEDLKIHNSLVIPSKGGPVERELSTCPDVVIRHEENGFAISFSALDYSEHERTRYYYMMEGFDRDWVEAGNTHEAYYANLPSGKYNFRVRITNNNQSITETEKSLSVTILPPWHRTWWAISLFSLLGLGVLCALWYVFSRIRRVRKEAARRIREVHRERERAEQEREQEQRLNKIQMNYFANVAHEFRTPLTMIAGPVSQLAGSEGVKGQDRQMVNIIQRSATWMLSLVDQLLDFNRIGDKKLHLKVAECDIISPLCGIVDLFRVNAEAKGVELGTYGLEDKYMMWADIDKVQKIVMNLLSNALKFTPQGGKVAISFDVLPRDEVSGTFPLTENDTAGQYAQITVSDTGCGIPEDQLEKIFERFYQAENQQGNKNTQGSGIGLYYARLLSSLHHGYIKAWNRDEGGAVFSFVIPSVAEAYSDDERQPVPAPYQIPAKLAEPQVLEPVQEESRKRVAVVDDDIDIASYLKLLLSSSYNVSVYYDAPSALKGMEEEAPDLVISDVVMPGMSGYELCETIKNDIQLSHIAVILVTAKVAVESQVQGLDKGADAYVTKPFQPAYLMALVKSLLDNRDKLRRQISSVTTAEELPDEALTPRDATFLKELYDLMEKELANTDLDITRMTEMMKISRTKFYYKVKGLTGENPSVFFKRYKLNRAATLLKEGKFNMSEIAYMTGFNTLSHFSTSFKKQFGVPPSEYVG